MDLAELKPSERIIDILNPKTDSEIGIKVTLISINDDRLKKIKRRIQDDRLRLEAKGKNFKSEDIEDNRSKLIFGAVTGWVWGKDASGEEVTFKGEKPEFNQKNFNMIMQELPWFRDQIEEAISDEKAFF